MIIGFPTIVIPAIQGGDGRDSSKGEFRLTNDQISWLSMFYISTYNNKMVLILMQIFS